MIRPALSALLLCAAPPALALDCTPQTSCNIEGNCQTGSEPESAFRLTLDTGGVTLVPIGTPAPGETPLRLAALTGGDSTQMQSFFSASSPAGDAVMLTLLDERQFTLSVHGHGHGTPYAFLSEGNCKGVL
ncbi:hypothetical protein [Vannielia sp. SX4]|uniref:hypothetical protein n=1 Tax=Vannielia sp. SX4 TaxID=3463852 RepID=UPI004058FF60